MLGHDPVLPFEAYDQVAIVRAFACANGSLILPRPGRRAPFLQMNGKRQDLIAGVFPSGLCSLRPDLVPALIALFSSRGQSTPLEYLVATANLS